MYAFLADAVIVLHALFVLFVVAGQLLIMSGCFLRWGWTRNPIFRVLHISAILVVVAEAWLGIVCPLTILEYKLRGLAGQATHEMSFVGYWMNRLLYFTAPEWVFIAVYSVFALLVIGFFVFYPPLWRKPGVSH